MNTSELEAMLARGAGAVQHPAAARRFALGLGWGALGATLLMSVLLGVRHDLDQAAGLPMFWVKIAFAAVLVAGSVAAALRVSRPGAVLGRAPVTVALALAAIWLLAGADLLAADPGARTALVFGRTWRVCPWNIALLSVPGFAAAIWAMRGLAPTRLRLAGASAGMLAGALGALVYSLHCPEQAAPFIAVWYVAGIAIPAAVGALVGPQLLRW